MTTFFDSLETRSHAEREADLMTALSRQITHAQAHAPAFAALLKGVDGPAINSRAALARLPVTRKHELLERQQAARQAGGDVFGGFSALHYGAHMPHVFASPGTIYEPEGTRKDYWLVKGARAGKHMGHVGAVTQRTEAAKDVTAHLTRSLLAFQ